MDRRQVMQHWEQLTAGQRLRELRELCGLSRAGAEAEVEVNRFTLKNWEMGLTNPSADDYMRLVQHYLGLLRAQ